MQRVSPWRSAGSSQHSTSAETWRSSVAEIVDRLKIWTHDWRSQGATLQKPQTSMQKYCLQSVMLLAEHAGPAVCSDGHRVRCRTFLVPFPTPPAPNLYLPCAVCSSKLTNFSAWWDTHYRNAAQISIWRLRSRDCSRESERVGDRDVAPRARSLSLMERRSVGEDF